MTLAELIEDIRFEIARIDAALLDNKAEPMHEWLKARRARLRDFLIQCEHEIAARMEQDRQA